MPRYRVRGTPIELRKIMVPEHQETMFAELSGADASGDELTSFAPSDEEEMMPYESADDSAGTASEDHEIVHGDHQETTQWRAEAPSTRVAQSLPVLTVDDFAALEERVLRAVELVRREREARIAAEAGAAAAIAEAVRLQAETASTERLQQEIDALRAEREQVRIRVERLLSQLDALEI
jgi:hypothetical protein